jgi:hypothetical protein
MEMQTRDSGGNRDKKISANSPGDARDSLEPRRLIRDSELSWWKGDSHSPGGIDAEEG